MDNNDARRQALFWVKIYHLEELWKGWRIDVAINEPRIHLSYRPKHLNTGSRGRMLNPLSYSSETEWLRCLKNQNWQEESGTFSLSDSRLSPDWWSHDKPRWSHSTSRYLHHLLYSKTGLFRNRMPIAYQRYYFTGWLLLLRQGIQDLSRLMIYGTWQLTWNARRSQTNFEPTSSVVPLHPNVFHRLTLL